MWQPSWSCDPDAINKLSVPLPIQAPCKIQLWLPQWFPKGIWLNSFPYMSLCGTTDPWGGTFFYHRAIIWITVIGVHKIKLHTKYQRPGPSSFRQEDFLSFDYRSIYNKIWPFRTQGQPKIIIFYTLLGPHVAYKVPGPFVLWFWRRRFIKGFYPIWAWWPSWLCDPETFAKRSLCNKIWPFHKRLRST